MAKNGLKSGIHRASLSGSYKTQKNTIQQANLVADAIKDSGFGVQKWENVNNKHFAAAADRLREEGLKDSTIIQYLSSARQIANVYGNERLSTRSADFGLAREDRVEQADKSANEEVYREGLEKLSAGDEDRQRLAVQVQYQRELGLRTEEAYKLDARYPNIERDPSGKESIRITQGTKGGKERWVPLSKAAKEALEKGRALQEKHGSKNLMPPEKSERQWRDRVYNLERKIGWNKNSGCTNHRLRHSFAQDLFREKSGFAAPCKFSSKEEFWQEAKTQSGDLQLARERYEYACREVERALGHGEGRDDIRCVYTGRA